MLSPTAITLIVALPLLFLASGILLLRSWLLLRLAADDQQLLNEECAELQKRLATFPKAWDGQQEDTGFSRGEVSESFSVFQCKLGLYIDRRIDSKTPRNESASRIEALLFPERPPEHRLTAGKDTRIFPNPHQYTLAEICTFLEQANVIRKEISHYIMSSILLHAVSLEGNPSQTLLPLGPLDMYGLEKLKTFIRGVDLSPNVRVHISKFGFYYAHKGDTKKRFITLLESLLDPYFKRTESTNDIITRRLELEEIVEAALQHGMKALGQAHDKTEYRWSTRVDDILMSRPALHALTYEDEKLKWDTEVVKSQVTRIKDDQGFKERAIFEDVLER